MSIPEDFEDSKGHELDKEKQWQLNWNKAIKHSKIKIHGLRSILKKTFRPQSQSS